MGQFIQAFLPLISGVLSFRVPGLNISFLELSVFLFTLKLVGVVLHAIYHDGGGDSGKDSSFTRGRK